MAIRREDGSVELADGRTVYADSLIQGQDLLEILDLVVPTHMPAPTWPFASGGGGGGGNGSGRRGPQGPAGTGGSIGPSGLQGAQGAQGFQGLVGSQTTVGNLGPQGPDSGTQGPQGSQGNQGVFGSQGFSGDTGPGVQGPQGFIGTSTTPGNQGFQGNQGFAGIDNAGAQGNEGFQGQDGGGGGFNDDGTVVRLTDSTDNVSIGTATAGGKVFVEGDTDELQLQVRGGPGQAVPIITFEDSTGSDIFNVTESGTVVPGADSTREIGTSSLRWASMAAASFNVFGVLGDANPVARIDFTGATGRLLFGPGGATAVDTGLRRVTAAANVAVTEGSGSADGILRPVTDAAGEVGTSSFRYAAMAANQFNVFSTAGHANPVARIDFTGATGRLLFGPGGATAVDTGLRRVTAAANVAVTEGSGSADGTLQPVTDAAGEVGTSSFRYVAMVANQFNVFSTAGHANPVARIDFTGVTGRLLFGPGAATALDTSLRRLAASQISPAEGSATVTGDFVPLVDNAGNVGIEALRWSLVRAVTITPGDMNLESADGKRAWTLREGTDHLWAINRKNGKKYRVKLREVDEVEERAPEDIPAMIA